MKYEKELTISESVDVLVVGGGPAGMAAAVASARLGKKTTLVEQYGFLGGMATSAMVGPYMTSYDRRGKTQIVRGVFDEFVRLLANENGAIHPSQTAPATPESGFHHIGHTNVTPFDSEAIKRLASAYCIQNGVNLRFHTFFVDARLSDRNIIVYCADKSGLIAIEASRVIDCTGDGDVAFRLGLPTMQGRDGDGKTQPCTMFFRIRGVDSKKLEARIRSGYNPNSEKVSCRAFHDLVEQGRETGEFTVPKGHLTFFKDIPEDEWRINTSRILDIDATNPEDLTKAEIIGRNQVYEIFQFIKKHIPGCENILLVDSGPQVGIRESRRIVGKYILNKEDILSGRDFEDTVAYYAYPLDLHDPKGTGVVFSDISKDAYQIPYRCLVSVNLPQLMMAGRCVSCTHEALAGIRVMPCCFALGEAAGTGAALSLYEGVLPDKLEYGKLREQLLKQNCYLG